MTDYDGPERRNGYHVICRQESEIALLLDHTNDMRKSVSKILTILDGNGKVGMKTQVELNKQALGRMWWAIGFVAVGIVGGLIRVFFA